MQNKSFRSGPVALGTSAANILNGNVTSLGGPVGITLTQPVLTVKKVTVVNKTGSAATVSLYIGATAGSAAGTEYLFNGYSVPANSYVERFVTTRLESADFLSGLAGTTTALTIEIEGEVGFQ